MGYFRKTLERRTFSQDRYNILIKRQRSGKATFSELTELDEIVNRVPDIREKVIIESFFAEGTDEAGKSPKVPGNDDKPHGLTRQRPGLWNKIRSFVNRIFVMLIHTKTREFYSLY
ncbi:MAG: hypothetical protein ACHQHN_14540 [Sphingobacteriales bacterium]